MPEITKSTIERREFFRINFERPLEFKSYASDRIAKAPDSRIGGVAGQSQNISSSGILFNTEKNPPQLSSILWMNLDIRTLKICKEIEERALVLNNGLLGRVVRVEEDKNGYSVGVCFLTQEERNSREIKQLLANLT